VVLGERGRGDEAEARFTDAAALIEEHGIVALKPRLTVYRMHFLRRAVPHAHLRCLLEEAHGLSEQLHDLRFSAGALTALADLAFCSHYAEEAAATYARAVQTYAQTGFHTAVPLVRFSEALTFWLAGDTKRAEHELFELCEDLTAVRTNAFFARAALAGLYAEMGEASRSSASFAECDRALTDGNVAKKRALAIFRLLLEARAPEGLSAARAAHARCSAWTHETPGSNSEVVLAHELVGARLELLATEQGAARAVELRIGSEGSWFQVGGGARVSLGRRQALRRILSALGQREETRWLNAKDLFAIGWPGERARGRSAEYRVYTAIKTLRALGLAEVLRTGPDGYRIVTSVDAPRQVSGLAKDGKDR
jgi:hypothetical protein